MDIDADEVIEAAVEEQAKKTGQKPLLGLATKCGNPVPLKEVAVEVSIQSFIAQVQSTLLYANTEDVAVEATFTFPLDDASAVFRFEADIEDRHIIAEVQEKEQAQLTYQDAIEKGQTALLLKEDRTAGDIFQCMLGNLPPGCQATLTFTYVVELPQGPDGKLTFTLPSVLNPRYSPGEQGSVAAEGAVYVAPAAVPYSFMLSACVTSSSRVLGVTSEREKLDVTFEDDQHLAKVTLAEAFTFDHDLSLLVEYEDCYKPHVVLEIGDPDANGLLKEDLLMLNFRPDLKEVAMATNGEYIFVIDRSGSMGGDEISDAREALLLLVKSLPPDCYFNIVGFGSNFTSLFKFGSKQYSSSNVKTALSHIKGIEADMGGTELLQPLKHIFTKSTIDGHPRQIFLLTDGGVSNTQEVIGLVKNNAPHCRLFALGIGSGVSTSLVKGVARAGNGYAEFITKGQRLQTKVISVLRCAMQPAVSNVTFEWDLPPGITHTSIPAEPPHMIIAGERLILFALLHGIDYHTIYAPSSVTLKGQHNSQEVSYAVPFRLGDDTEVSGTLPLHRMAAKAQIKLLEATEAALHCDEDYLSEDNARDITKIREQMLQISLHGNIVSKMTSFVAVDKENKKLVEGTMVERPCPIPTTTREFSDGVARGNISSCGLFATQDEGLRACGLGTGDVEVDCYKSIHDLQTLLIEQNVALAKVNCKQVELGQAHSAYQKKKSIGCGPSRSSIRKFFSFKNRQKHKPGARPSQAPADASGVPVTMGTDGERPTQAPADASGVPVTMGTDEQSESLPDMIPTPVPVVEVSGVPVAIETDEQTKSVADRKPTPAPVEVSHVPVTIETDEQTKSLSDENMLSVIALQEIHGNWCPTQEVTSLLGITMETLKSCTILKDKTALITLAVVAWLRKRLSHRRAEWTIIETKAVNWIALQDLPGTPLDTLISDVENAFWPDG